MLADMTTASEYRRAASVLTGTREMLARITRPLDASANGVVLAGPARTPIMTAIDVTAANVASALAQLQAEIDEARRRAAVCDAYSRAVRDHLRSNDPDARWPRRSAGWVEYE